MKKLILLLMFLFLFTAQAFAYYTVTITFYTRNRDIMSQTEKYENVVSYSYEKGYLKLQVYKDGKINTIYIDRFEIIKLEVEN